MRTTLLAIIVTSAVVVRTGVCEMAPGAVDLSFDAGSKIAGTVYGAAMLGDGRVLITGSFGAVSGAAANGAAMLLPTGATDLTFTNSLRDYTVDGRAAAVLPDGRLLLGGYFSPVWYLSTGLVRLNADGSIDTSFTSPASSYVYGLAVQNDGKVLVAGSFNSSGRRGVLRLNADGTLDNTFLYGLSGANGTVNAVAVLPNGQVVIGGTFTTVNGSIHNGVARLNADGSVDESFLANVTGVTALAVQTDGKLVISGSFTVVNGASLNRIARLNTDGSLDGSFLSGMTGIDSSGANVKCLSIQSDGKVLVGGLFSSVNGSAQMNLVRLTTSGSVDGAFSTGPGGVNGIVNAITLQPNGQTIVAGAFSSVGGVLRNQIARLGTSGSPDTSFVNGTVIFSDSVSALAVQADGKILANAVAGKQIGRFLTNGAPDAFFLAGLAGANAPVKAISVTPSGKILAAGYFSQFNGFPALALARLDAGGSVDATFQNGIGGTSASLECLKLQPDGKILIGGVFTQIRGVARTNLARLNADGSLDATFMSASAGVNGTVYSIALQTDGKILLGGSFSSVNGVARGSIARLNSDGSLDRTFQERMAGVSGKVYAIVPQPDRNVLIAGSFSSVNGTNTTCVARLGVDGSNDTNFNAVTTTQPLKYATALALQSDGRILVGGLFDYIQPAYVNNIARLRPNGTPEGFLPNPMGANAQVTALLPLDDTRVLVGGAFGTLNSAPRSYLARLYYNTPTVPLEVALDNSQLRWTNDLVAPWQGQALVSHDLVASAQSGSLTDSQSSTLSSSITGPGCLSFWWKVSSEAAFDFLTFTCTGAALTNTLRISGEVDWQQKTVCIPAGVFALTWTYSKDVSVSMGQDAGWVDQVTFTPGNQAPIISQDPSSATNYAGATVGFSASGTGILPLSYQWLLNGVEIPGATNATYTIQSVVPEQAGTYTLRLSNPYGASFSGEALLTVIPVRAAGAAGYTATNTIMSTVATKAIAAGQYHSIVLRRDGSIYAWGNNVNGQCNVPSNLGPALGIAAGGYHSLAVKANHTVAGWGGNSLGQATPPAGLTNVLTVAAGLWHSLALRQNGTVVGWGDNSYGQATPPAGLSNIIAIAAGGAHSLALRADGLVFGWGGNLNSGGAYSGQASVPRNLNGVAAIGAGGYHSVAVRNDGTIVGWGDNSSGQLTVPTNLPPAVAIAGGSAHTVAAFADGTAAGWGQNFDGQCDISRSLTNVVAVAAGQAHSLLLFGQRLPPPEALTPSRSGNVFSVQVATYDGKFYALEYTSSLTSTNWVTLPAVLGNGHVLPLTDPSAIIAPRYYRVRQW